MTHAGTAELPSALWRNPEPNRSYDVMIKGCRRWFDAVRDIVTYRFLAVHRPGGEAA